MSKQSQYYTPGVCNINKPEVAYRQRVGYGFLVAVAVLVVGTAVLSAPVLVALLTFPLAFIGVLNMLQARNKFCVLYASTGKFNSSDAYADTDDVVDAAAKALDARKSRKMYVQSFAVSMLLTAGHAALLSFL
jgi:hypothetical protein